MQAMKPLILVNKQHAVFPVTENMFAHKTANYVDMLTLDIVYSHLSLCNKSNLMFWLVGHPEIHAWRQHDRP